MDKHGYYNNAFSSTRRDVSLHCNDVILVQQT